MGKLVYKIQLHGFITQKTSHPSGTTFGRLAASQGNDLVFLRIIQYWGEWAVFHASFDSNTTRYRDLPKTHRAYCKLTVRRYEHTLPFDYI